MDFKTAVRICLLQKYCDFRGRARRAEFWWFVLFGGIVNIGLGMMTNAAPQEGVLAARVVTAVLLLPHFAVTARRLHDANLSGWMQVVPVSLALLGGAAVHLDFGTSAYMCIMLAGLSGLWLIILYARPGTAGANRFGPDPLESGTPVQEKGREQGQKMPPSKSSGTSGAASDGAPVTGGGADSPDAAWARLASNPAREQGGEKKPAAMRPGQRAVPDKRD
ncbi:DUF805 domain-containing protein [Desulfovibrio sp.]|uniref:DUF805 domain-containing protein n=1 Tax=Desulfovibrio sp. TaxID=885 RepID=UPI0025C5C4AD|nr:DUF805 domain-containing protein [Desulfovibrio sp.]